MRHSCRAASIRPKGTMRGVLFCALVAALGTSGLFRTSAARDPETASASYDAKARSSSPAVNSNNSITTSTASRFRSSDIGFGPSNKLSASGALASLIGPAASNFSLSLNAAGAYVNVPNSASLNITGAITVEAWIKTNLATVQQGIIERYNTFGFGTFDGGYALRLAGGKLQFYTLKNGNEFDVIESVSPVSTGVWHHVAGVYSGSSLSVYIDGTLSASKASTFAPGTGTASTKIGARGDDSSNTAAPFSGLIDEARITAAAVYSANFTPQPSLTALAGTKGLWKFDDQTANDSSGNLNHGSLISGATFSPDVPANAAGQLGVGNFGFEAPAIGVGNFQYNPAGGSWTFAGSSGVTANGSGFTSGNPGAPEGGQVAFLQTGSSSVISQSISGFQASTSYTVTFAAAQRANCCNAGGEDFQVYLDSATLLGTFHPNSTSYADYSTSGFTTTAGAHLLSFVGLNSLGGDHSAFIDNVRITANGSAPVGYWKFDEGSAFTTADSSGGGNNGTLQNGVTWTTGAIGGALNFNGIDGYVQVGSAANLVMSNTMSLTAWVYPNSTGSGIVVNKEGEYEIAIAGTIQWAIANTNPGWAWINTGYSVPVNQWTHLAFVYDNGTAKTYANGTLVHTYAGAGSIGDVSPTQNDFRIGGRQCCVQYFQGRLDEVRMYNRALSAAEIQSLSGGACGYSISPASGSFTASGGSGSVTVTAGAGCAWTTASNATWITITSASSGSGNGTVNYSVAANTEAARSGTMTIAGQTFTVTQDAAACTYSITPASQSFTASGGTGAVSVTAGVGCAWTAASNATWITITSGASGSGNGTVNYSVATNTGAARSGTVTIAGQTFTVSQAATNQPKITGITATASGTWNSSVPALAVDGNLSTNWNSGSSVPPVCASCPPQWILLDLGQPYNISQLKLYVNQVPNGTTTHNVYAGATAGTLSLVATFSGVTNDGDVLTKNFSPSLTNIRYVKVETTQSPSWVAWNEIEVYGVASGPPTNQSPFNGPHNIPGITQAEDFDNGGEGVAYHDTTPGNGWGRYRTDVDVDIAPDSGASGGFVVGNAMATEWLEYTVNVTAAGSYDIIAKVASGGPGGVFHYVIDPDNPSPVVTPPVTAPNTGWGVYTNAPAVTVNLTSGTHIIRVSLDQNGTQQYSEVADFDYFSIVTSGSSNPPTVSITAPSNGQSFNAPANITIDASAIAGSSRTITRVDYYQNSSWIGQVTAPIFGSTYRFTWNNVSVGNYSLTAIATDNLNATTTSTAVSVTVNSTPTLPPLQPPTDSLTANQIGRLTSVGNGSMRIFNSYDALGRTTQTIHKLDGTNYVTLTRYGYPQNSGSTPGLGAAVSFQSLPDFERLDYTYDAGGAQQSIKTTTRNGSQQTIVSSVQRNARGQTTQVVYGNNAVSTHKYQGDDPGDIPTLRLKQIKTVVGVTTLQDYTYSFDNNGNVTSVTDNFNQSLNAIYGYDSLDQLISMTGDGLVRPYAYDALGNLIKKENSVQNQTYGGAQSCAGCAPNRGPHALATAQGLTYNYDANGNLIETRDSGNNVKTAITWNAENMPIQVVQSGITMYTKFFLGEMLWKKVEPNNFTTYYMPSMRVENGQFRKFFGGFAERSPDGTLKFYHNDHLGSASLVTDAAGYFIRGQAYMPFGEDRPNSVSGSFTDARYQFNFKEKESTGFYDYGARLYNPATGRWLSPDTFARDGLNRYAYVRNNPLRYVDPTGHDSRYPSWVTTREQRTQWDKEEAAWAKYRADYQKWLSSLPPVPFVGPDPPQPPKPGSFPLHDLFWKLQPKDRGPIISAWSPKPSREGEGAVGARIGPFGAVMDSKGRVYLEIALSKELEVGHLKVSPRTGSAVTGMFADLDVDLGGLSAPVHLTIDREGLHSEPFKASMLPTVGGSIGVRILVYDPTVSQPYRMECKSADCGVTWRPPNQ